MSIEKTIYGLCDKHLGYGITNLIVFSLNMIFIQMQLTFVSSTMPRTIISSSLLLQLVIFIVAKLKTLFNTWVKLFKSQAILTHMWAHTMWKIKSTKWYFWTRTIVSKRFYMIIDFRMHTQWQFMHILKVISFCFLTNVYLPQETFPCKQLIGSLAIVVFVVWLDLFYVVNNNDKFSKKSTKTHCMALK